VFSAERYRVSLQRAEALPLLLVQFAVPGMKKSERGGFPRRVPDAMHR
jgi:hypothetical protein